jgi:hypothetical protein
MAPGTRLSKDSPMGNDIQDIIRGMLKKELSVMAWSNSDDTISIQLVLGDELIGMQLKLDTYHSENDKHGWQTMGYWPEKTEGE